MQFCILIYVQTSESSSTLEGEARVGVVEVVQNNTEEEASPQQRHETDAEKSEKEKQVRFHFTDTDFT